MELLGIINTLENTTKLHKDLLLGQLLSTNINGSPMAPRARRKFHIGSLSVCKCAFQGILGIGGSRLTRLQGGRIDSRFGDRVPGDPRGHQGNAYGEMFTHLWAVYNSHAETRADDDVMVDEHDPLQVPSAESRKQVGAFRAAKEASQLPSEVTLCPKGRGFMIEPTEDTPKRWLPPGAKMDVWWLYVAQLNAEGGKPAHGSYTTLLRVWGECFQKVLKVEKFGSHPKCNDCYRLKQSIQLAATYADKLSASKKLTTHLEQQWRDRMVYWRMRAHARTGDAKWLVIIIDGADQAKFRVLKSVDTPKAVEGLWRPKMKVVGAWAHGCDLSFTFVEEDMPHNTNLTIDILMQSLSRILARAATQRTTLPCHLWVQMDNCSGDNKSGHMCKWFSWLVDAGIFRSTVASYLQVGHTHEDIDFLFSVMSTGIAKMQAWDTPQQMADCVQRNMAAHVRRTLKEIPVASGMLPAVRNWMSWLDGYADIRYNQGLEGITKLHWMCFLRRRDLPITLSDQNTGEPAHGSSANDVMLLCKQYMSDNVMNQSPMMFAPGGSASAMQPPNGPVAWEARKGISHELLNNFCEKLFEIMPERAPAVTYLRQWESLPRMHSPPPQVLPIALHRYGVPLPGHEFGPAFAAAMQTDDGGPQSKPAVIRRRKRQKNTAPPEQFKVSLAAYAAYRCQQGVTLDEAVAEWNGGRIAHENYRGGRPWHRSDLGRSSRWPRRAGHYQG